MIFVGEKFEKMQYNPLLQLSTKEYYFYFMFNLTMLIESSILLKNRVSCNLI